MPVRLFAAALALALGSACASPPAPAPTSRRVDRAEVARTAEGLLGRPYRYGGSSPEGFDCSGLVVYSFAKAGLAGLPHSAAALDSMSKDVPLEELQPGDLLFFNLGAHKTSHVGIYVGNREFVHAPSSGKRVEKVSFDDVYWGEKLNRAGRLAP